MATLTIEATPQPISALPRFVNSASSALVTLFINKLLPYPISGAAVGYFYDKTITFTLCSTMQSLIESYLTPYTIEPLFINKHSNSSSKLVGIALIYATSLLGSYYVTKKLTQQIPHYFPSAMKIVEENKKPFNLKHAVFLSFAPLAIDAVFFVATIASIVTLFATKVMIGFAAGQIKRQLS